MTQQRLTDRHGKYIGYREDRGNTVVLYDSHGRRLGEYNKTTNRTTDAHGRFVGNGDLLGTLIVGN